QGSSYVSFGYDLTGRRTSLALANGIVAAYTYDAASELAGVSYSLAGNVLGDLSYTYDQDARRTQVSGSWARMVTPNPTTSIALYNAGNQLTSWNGNALNYDANGNLIWDGASVYTWDARNHLASASG